jgi:hypothetical protein
MKTFFKWVGLVLYGSWVMVATFVVIVLAIVLAGMIIFWIFPFSHILGTIAILVAIFIFFGGTRVAVMNDAADSLGMDIVDVYLWGELMLIFPFTLPVYMAFRDVVWPQLAAKKLERQEQLREWRERQSRPDNEDDHVRGL